MRITILLKKDSLDFKGEFLAAHNRIKYLLDEIPNAEMQVYLLSEYDGFWGRIIKRRKKREQVPVLVFDGIEYHYIWQKSSLIDSAISRLGGPRIYALSSIKRMIKKFDKSDLVIAHSFYAGYLALQIKKYIGIPYTVTWHGSDIHTNPFANKYIYNETKEIIKNADQNFFVSEKLKSISERIYSGGSKQVLYNGVNIKLFKHLSDEDILALKKKYNISPDIKSIAFIGNLYPVKNAGLLPDIFVKIKEKYLGLVNFHIIGDGFLRESIEKRANILGVAIRFWGNMFPSDIPNIINCMDLVVLPSRNEGLPLITLETMACGVKIIGSNVGGIAEAIGTENTVELGDNFVDRFSELACEKLHDNKKIVLDEKFTWSTSAHIEAEFINKILVR